MMTNMSKLHVGKCGLKFIQCMNVKQLTEINKRFKYNIKYFVF